MRLAGLDLIRVVGVAAVVTGHVYPVAVAHQVIYPWHVPLFFFLTGYFWTSGRTLERELTTRALTLLVPYATWLVLDVVVRTAVVGFSPAFVLNALWGGSRATGPVGAFWFITALFFTSVLHRVLERFPRPVPWAVAVLGLVLCALLPGRLDDLPLAVGMALPCLTFVLFGRLARTTTPSGVRGRVLGAGLLLCGVLSVILLPIGTIDLKVAAVGTPVLGIATSTLLCWGLVALARDLRLPPVVGRAVVALASVAVTVVLTHTVVIWYLQLHDVPTGIVLVAALVAPWVLALVLHRLPGARLTTGAARVERPTKALSS